MGAFKKKTKTLQVAWQHPSLHLFPVNSIRLLNNFVNTFSFLLLQKQLNIEKLADCQQTYLISTKNGMLVNWIKAKSCDSHSKSRPSHKLHFLAATKDVLNKTRLVNFKRKER